MSLFKPDLFRSFATGFALGALALFVTLTGRADKPLAEGVIPVAAAATQTAIQYPDLTRAPAVAKTAVNTAR